MPRALLAGISLLLQLPAGAGGPEATTLTVHFDWPAGAQVAAEPRQVSLELMPVSGGAPLRRQVAGSSSVELPVAVGQRYWLSAHADGYWAADLDLSTTAEPGPVRVRFLPAGQLRAALVPPRGGVLPATIEARLDASLGAKQPRDLPTSFVKCPIADGRISCDLPAGKLDVRLAVDGFAGHYLWAVSIPAGDVLDVGTLALQPGSSIAGWVRLSESGEIPAAQVELARAQAGAVLDAEPRQQLQRLGLTTRANERGFFQLTGVPPGTYEVRVRLAGFAPRKVGPIAVQEGLESQLQEPILLDRPATVEVVPEPPTDPYGRPWAVTLIQESDPFRSSHRALPGEEGVYRASDLPPGTYQLRVSDADGGQWIIDDRRLAPGLNRVPLEISVVEVRGHALIGEKPLAARLQFHAENRKAARVRLDSDLEGNFEGYLPFEGTWRVTLASEAERMSVSLPPLEVRLPPGKSYAEVELRVPDTRLEGRVLDPTGKPVAAADVRAFPDSATKGQNVATTDERGAFHFRGLPEGSYTVIARREEQDSNTVPVSLDEDLDAPEVTLVLRGVREVVGVVQSFGRNLPGARVIVLPDLSSSGAGSPVETSTGAGGIFRAKLPADSAFLTFVVAAPSHAIHMLRVAFPPPGQQVPIEVEPAGGTLSLTAFISRPQAPGGRLPMPILFHNGAAVPLPLLLNLTAPARGLGLSNPNPFEISNLEPGEYTACIGKLGTRAWREGASAPREGCASGLLRPHSILELNPPAPTASASP